MIVRHVLSLVPSNAEVSLDTQEWGNVLFYQSLGFVLCSEVKSFSSHFEGFESFSSWNMLYPKRREERREGEEGEGEGESSQMRREKVKGE
jgi:hypothetical protein